MLKRIYTILIIALVLVSSVLVGPMVVQPAMAQGGVTTFTNLNVSNFYRANERTAITVTQDMDFTPTGTFQPITAAGAVSFSGDDLTVRPEGSILILVNVGSNTITITETTNIKSAGNIALGAADSATLISDGSDWYQIAASNN